MVIGVDAGALAVTDNRLRVGVYRVIYHLLKELAVLDSQNTYRLYSFNPLDEEFLQHLPPQMNSLVLTPKYGWFSWRLPLSLLIHPVDVFLGISQALPMCNGKGIGFIYDLGFLQHPELYPGSHKRLVSQTNDTVKRSRKIITISQASKKDIVDHYHISEDKVVVAYPGVDESFSNVGERFVSKTPYFLHVGSLKPGKNIPQLILGFSQFLRKSQKDYVLLLVGGDYWLDEDILPTITKCGLEEKVRLLGFVPDKILKEYYRGAEAFLSLSVSEGFCLPILEAMACGIPVVASNTGAIPELAPDTSLLSDPLDLEAFATNIQRLTQDEELKKIVIAKGIAKSQEYRWPQFAQIVYEVMQSLS